MTPISYEQMVTFVDGLSVSQQNDLYQLLLVKRAQRQPPSNDRQPEATDVITMWLAIRNSIEQPKDKPNAPQG